MPNVARVQKRLYCDILVYSIYHHLISIIPGGRGSDYQTRGLESFLPIPPSLSRGISRQAFFLFQQALGFCFVRCPFFFNHAFVSFLNFFFLFPLPSALLYPWVSRLTVQVSYPWVPILAIHALGRHGYLQQPSSRPSAWSVLSLSPLLRGLLLSCLFGSPRSGQGHLLNTEN